jgi:magnesium transporter
MSNVDDQERLDPSSLAELLASGSDPAVERLLAGAHPADLAEALDHIEDPGAKLRLFTTLDDEAASRVLRDASESARAFLLTALPDVRLTSILEHLETDDAADLVGGLPEERRATLLQRTDAETRREVAELLTYAADTAGGIMKAEVPAVPAGTSARDVVDYLRRNAEKLSDVWDVFVVDAARHVVGRLPLRRLVLANDQQRVDEIMEREVVSVRTDTDQEEVAHQFEKYDLTSAPVLDASGRLVGCITVDDVVDVIEEEATEDMLALAGVSGTPGETDGALRNVRNRLPWLTLNLVTAAVSAITITRFEDTIRVLATAAALMTIVASQGGNAGVQTMTLVVRGLALGELDTGQIVKVVRRELAIALTHGCVLGSVSALAVYAWRGDARLGAIVGAALLANFVVAAMLGSLVPIGLKLLRVDPAVSSSVFVTAGTDVAGFLIFLGLLTWAL